MIYKIVKSAKDKCYDCFDEYGKWVFTRVSPDNVFTQLSKLSVTGITFEDREIEDIMRREVRASGV